MDYRDCERCKALLERYYAAAERYSEQTVRLSQHGDAPPDEFQTLYSAVTTARNECLAARGVLQQHRESLTCEIRRQREQRNGNAR